LSFLLEHKQQVNRYYITSNIMNTAVDHDDSDKQFKLSQHINDNFVKGERKKGNVEYV